MLHIIVQVFVSGR